MGASGTPRPAASAPHGHEHIRAAMSMENILSSPQPAASSTSMLPPQTSPAPVTSCSGAELEAAKSASLTPVPTDVTGAGSPIAPAPASLTNTEQPTDTPGGVFDDIANDTISGDATTTDITGNAAAHREFDCMADEYTECTSGQYTLNLSRKVISDHFGRNKGCTRLIEDWPLFCRKHYQRCTYRPETWQHRKILLILRQVQKIEELHPGTTYDVVLKKSEEKRLNEFARKRTSGMPEDQAEAAVAPDSNVKSFQAPIGVLRELEAYLGPNRIMTEVQSAVLVIQEMLKKNVTTGKQETTQVPSIEFLPFFPGSRNKPKAKPKAKPAPKGKNTRVSAKGAVKKANKKA